MLWAFPLLDVSIPTTLEFTPKYPDAFSPQQKSGWWRCALVWETEDNRIPGSHSESHQSCNPFIERNSARRVKVHSDEELLPWMPFKGDRKPPTISKPLQIHHSVILCIIMPCPRCPFWWGWRRTLAASWLPMQLSLVNSCGTEWPQHSPFRWRLRNTSKRSKLLQDARILKSFVESIQIQLSCWFCCMSQLNVFCRIKRNGPEHWLISRHWQ